MSKVFCKDCIYDYWGAPMPDHICKAPVNFEDNWYGTKRCMIHAPREKNKNNDCKDYKQKHKPTTPWWKRIFYIPGDKERIGQ